MSESNSNYVNEEDNLSRISSKNPILTNGIENSQKGFNFHN